MISQNKSTVGDRLHQMIQFASLYSSATFFSAKYLLTDHRGNKVMVQSLGADFKKSTFKDQ